MDNLYRAKKMVLKAKYSTRTIEPTFKNISLIREITKDPFFTISINNNTPRRLYHIFHYLLLSED